MEFKGKVVRFSMRHTFQEQRLWVFVGRVIDYSENWLCIEGKGLIVLKRAGISVEIDDECRKLMLPRETINVIRILPDDFDVDNIEAINEGHKLCLKVNGAPNATIADMSEIM